MQPSPELLLALHQHFNIPLASRARTSGINTALLQRGEDFYLIATNVTGENKGAEIELSPTLFNNGKWVVRDMVSGTAYTADFATSSRLNVQLPRKDGNIFHLSRQHD